MNAEPEGLPEPAGPAHPVRQRILRTAEFIAVGVLGAVSAC